MKNERKKTLKSPQRRNKRRVNTAGYQQGGNLNLGVKFLILRQWNVVGEKVECSRLEQCCVFILDLKYLSGAF